MVLKQHGAAWSVVQVWLPDEQETDVLAGTLEHSIITYGMFSDVDTYAQRHGLLWLVRPETQLLYQRTDDSTGSFYPDLIVALYVVINARAPYRVTVVGKAPKLIMEVLSTQTETTDTTGKIDAYAEMGVYEYLIVDPGLRGQPALIGRRLIAPSHYTVIPVAPEGGIWLDSIGLRVVLEMGGMMLGPRLRLFTPSGERLPHVEEEAAELQAERRARIEAEQARAEEERARMRAEQAQRQAEEAQRREVAARLQAEEARAEAEARARQAEEIAREERRQREHIEAEQEADRAQIARLRGLLARQGK